MKTIKKWIIILMCIFLIGAFPWTICPIIGYVVWNKDRQNKELLDSQFDDYIEVGNKYILILLYILMIFCPLLIIVIIIIKKVRKIKNEKKLKQLLEYIEFDNYRKIYAKIKGYMLFNGDGRFMEIRGYKTGLYYKIYYVEDYYIEFYVPDNTQEKILEAIENLNFSVYRMSRGEKAYSTLGGYDPFEEKYGVLILRKKIQERFEEPDEYIIREKSVSILDELLVFYRNQGYME